MVVCSHLLLVFVMFMGRTKQRERITGNTIVLPHVLNEDVPRNGCL
jgi:hypothetical protein